LCPTDAGHTHRNNLLAIKRYSAGTYAQRARKLARRCGARKDQYYSWELLGERSPCAIVSLRATEANNSPRLGPSTSRSIVHALVRLDTRQHLVARERKGGRYLIDEQREVVEHLVFERRLWQDGAPWVIRDQVWEGAPAEFADFSEQAAEPKPKKK
jgi:protein MBA1